MVPNCEGCELEYEEACCMARKGFHVATEVGRGVFDKGHHYGLKIVDDKGKLVMW